MKMIGVINASPLIYLAKLGVLRILPQLFSEVWTSDEVKREVLSKQSAPEIPILEKAFIAWLRLYTIKNPDLVTNLQKLNIHVGEASVIATAHELKQERKEPVAIIDDLTAREIARTFEIPVIGTVGILLKGAKEKFMTVEQCKNHLTRLVEETEFRMTIKLYSQLLKKLEEI